MDSSTHSLTFDQPVVLVGGASISPELMETLVRRDLPIVAADGGANQLISSGVVPAAIIGDLDSLEHRVNWERRTEVIEIAEQESSDFEKCLYSVQAPYFIAVGFCGDRLDHTLAVLHTAAKFEGKSQLLLVSEDDVIWVTRGDSSLDLPPNTRVSVVPLAPVQFNSSEGLAYPLDNLLLALGDVMR